MRLDNRRFDVEAIKRSHPVEVVISGYGAQLKSSGRGLVGRCPFHDDAEPSFYVYPATRSWYCYGECRAGGDVIKFVQLKEEVSFTHACEKLEALAPSSVSAPSKPPSRPGIDWEGLSFQRQLLMNTAAAVYQEALWRNAAALDYVRGRGLSDVTIRACGIGYADGQVLRTALRGDRFGVQLAHELGLLRRERDETGESQSTETLAGRVVVPEKRNGHAIWFVGRILPDQAPLEAGGGETKRYLALPGPRPLLGYERVRSEHQVFVTEGIFDYLTVVEWGLPICAIGGTYLPAERLESLAGAEIVLGVLDSDMAGKLAAERLADMLGPRLRQLRLPEGSDLNDLGRMPRGRQRFFALTGKAMKHLEENRHAA
ncbi:MAG: CHC2 zinc finger domain-containing protein [Chloroflexota bacterium]